MLKYLLFISVCMVLCSCVKYPEIVEVNNFKIQTVNEADVQVGFSSLIHNPNPFNIKADSVSFQICYGDDTMGEGIVDNSPVLKKNASTQVNGFAKISIHQLLKNIPDLINNDSLTLMFQMEIKLPHLGRALRREVPFQFLKSDFIHNSLVTDVFKENISLKSIQPVSANLSSSKVRISLELNNPFNSAYEISNVDLDVFSDKYLRNCVGTYQQTEPVRMEANAMTEMNIEVNIDHAKALSSVFGKITSGDLRQYIKGDIDIVFDGVRYTIPIMMALNPI